MTAGEMIQQGRVALGISREEMAEDFGHVANWLTRIENGTTRQQPQVYRKIGEYLDFSKEEVAALVKAGVDERYLSQGGLYCITTQTAHPTLEDAQKAHPHICLSHLSSDIAKTETDAHVHFYIDRAGNAWCFWSSRKKAMDEYEEYLAVMESDKVEPERNYPKGEWKLLYKSADPFERHPYKLINRDGQVAYACEGEWV